MATIYLQHARTFYIAYHSKIGCLFPEARGRSVGAARPNREL